MNTETVKTLLDVDVYSDYVQAVRIDSPPDKGDYTLIIELLSGNEQWRNCSTAVKLSVPGRSMWRWL